MSKDLDLYSKVEPYLNFDDEVEKLHNIFLELIDHYKPNTLLDVGCGRGDLLSALPKNIDTLGIDLSSSQIKICQSKGLNAKNISIDKVDKKFDMIIASFDVINYIKKDDLKNFFSNIYNILNDDGICIFDVNSKFAFEEIVQGAIVLDKDDKFITIDAEYKKSKLYTTITLFTNDNRCYMKEQETIVQYYHSIKNLKTIIKSVKLKFKDLLYFHLYNYEEADKLVYIIKK